MKEKELQMIASNFLMTSKNVAQSIHRFLYSLLTTGTHSKKDLLVVIMPKRKISQEELIELIKAKHKARYSARKSHHRRSSTLTVVD